ncbi:MAG TPA: preprotein translocase subunit SecA [Casimicrobiaceae bacterium]|nr:preprotein translocase subunit SecA [Casimicrobiaceae bacterium]
MISNILTRIFGSRNERLLKQYAEVVRKVNALEPAVAALSDDELRAKTAELKARVADGEALDDVMPDAFAVVREAGKRTLSMRHFDVQLIGGMALHYGKIAEMRTGEGKTLVATLPAYLNALSGKGVHIVTVNDYLAQRDADWMGRIYKFLGMTVGVNLSQMSHADKQVAYGADITYGTNNEFGFDYLRDNMVFSVGERVQRSLNYAIVDEVDSILIDEARTPLIISGQADDNVEMYYRLNEIAPKLTRQQEEKGPGDYWVDEKAHQVLLSEEGHERVESILGQAGLIPPGSGLYDAQNISLMHHLYAALRAHSLYHRDQHYVVQNGEVVIVDEFTGRLMAGRRWSEGLHQAVEAKEGVPIQKENQTLASITFQNYFRMYGKLAGMTGTADTEAFEFQQIYHLETVVIPTHMPMVRKDENDLVFRTFQEKVDAIIGDIKDCYARGQPVLVGTTSIENSELLSGYLTKEKLPHEVLNAKQHAREAEIVAQAGKSKSITIATNMAGRGTDIVLGGSIEPHILKIRDDESLLPTEKEREIGKLRSEWQARHDDVTKAGGLHIVGTERHESRRIDNQLRGRSGRQGDPGSSRFYLSLEDPLLRIFGGERLGVIMQKLKMPDGEPIEHPIVNRSIAKAQNRVESRNFDIRKQLLEYDDVANDQRRVIYQQRNELLESADVADTVRNMIRGQLEDTVKLHVPPESVEEQWDVPGLTAALASEYQINAPVADWVKSDSEITDEVVRDKVVALALATLQERESLYGAELMRQIERSLMLQFLDHHWREHLASLDHLRQGIHLRGYAQKNPKQEYKREAFELFSDMLDRIKQDVVKLVLTVQLRNEQDVQAVEETESVSNVKYQHAGYEEALAGAPEGGDVAVATAPPFTRASEKVGRNDPCPCGSGKKYKHCHGKF